MGDVIVGFIIDLKIQRIKNGVMQR